MGVQAQLQGIGCTDAAALIRLTTNDPDLIRLYLDMGLAGIVTPFINTTEQAELGTQACRYPPAGIRGFGPSRAAGYGFQEDYFQQANQQVLYLPIIESAEAVKKIDQLLAVEGVDSFFCGTG